MSIHSTEYLRCAKVIANARTNGSPRKYPSRTALKRNGQPTSAHWTNAQRTNVRWMSDRTSGTSQRSPCFYQSYGYPSLTHEIPPIGQSYGPRCDPDFGPPNPQGGRGVRSERQRGW